MKGRLRTKWSSAIEFRKSIEGIVFGGLTDLFKTKGKEISRNSNLQVLLGKEFTPSDGYEREDIGLRIPELRRYKAFGYMMM